MKLKQIMACCASVVLLATMSIAHAGTFVDVFAKNGTGANYSSGSLATAADAAGNVYTVGSFSQSGGALTLGGYTLNAIGANDAFIAKVGPTGTVLWARSFGGAAASTFLNSVALDASGNIFAAGDFFGGNLSTPFTTRIGNQDGLLVKLDTNGNLLWSRNYGGSGAQVDLAGVATDSSGNAVISGDFSAHNLSSPSLVKISTTSANYDALAIKVSASGGTVWAQNFGGPSANTNAYGVAIDSLQNVVLVGSFVGANMTMPAQTIYGYEDGFIMQLNSAGGLNWVRQIGNSPANTVAARVAVDGANNIGVVGTFTYGSITAPALTQIGTGSDLFAVKYSSSGSVLFGNAFGSASFCGASGASFDPYGNMVASGWCNGGNMLSPAITVTTLGMYAFVAEMNTTGGLAWATALTEGDYNVSASPAAIYANDGTRTYALSGIIYNANFSVSDPFVGKFALP
jgi:hypothetical protein